MTDVPVADMRRYGPRLAALSLAMLLPSLGTSIANVALPTLATSFDATMAEVQWVVISYLLAVTSLIVGVGRFGDMIGRSRLLLMGIGLFTAASAACALAPNLWVLIAARAVQGLGAAVMMALTVAMVGDLVPKDRTGSAMGLLGTVSAVGTALGPSLGGVLISGFGWPAVFATLAALGGITLLIGRALVPPDAKGGKNPAGFDVVGMALLAGSLLTAAAALTLGSRISGPVLAAAALVSALGFIVFVRHETRVPAPLVRIELLQSRATGTALLSMMLVSAILMATLVVGPFYLSGVLGLDAVQTGLVMSVGPGVAALIGAPAGRMIDRLGSDRVVVAGLIAVMSGTLLMTVLPGRFGVGGYLASLVIVTFGYALFQAANTTTVMQTTSKDQRGVTSALLGLSRNLGLIAGASAMGAIYAFGPSVFKAVGLPSESETGLQVTFAVATGLAALALGSALLGRRDK
ncbi:MAG: MFS transporter [Gemmobacter sp.]